MRGDNDNPDGGDAPVFVASWKALALPMLVVAVGYGALLAWLALSGRSESALARLSFTLLALGVPLLAAHALLRMATIKVQPRKLAVSVHVGFPRSRAVEAPYALISRLSVHHGMTARLTSSGTLVLHLVDGAKLAVPDLARPEAVRRDILRRMAGAAPVSVAALPAAPAEPAAASTLGRT